MLEIRLLGQFELRRDGTTVVVPSRAAQLLFAYLLLNGGALHRREKLAGLLWPDTTDDKARRNLRHELWRLRRAIEPQTARQDIAPYFKIDKISIGFNPASDYWFDVAMLQPPLSQTMSTDALIGTLALYHGDLLPGFDEEWVVLERARARAIFEGKLQALLGLLIQEQNWQDALEWGERWIALGQAPEPAYRALMIAHASQGNWSQAKSAYERCARGLHDSLGVEPSEETRSLFARLSNSESREERERSGSPQPSASRTSEVGILLHRPASLLHPRRFPVPFTTFVGREHEIEQITNLITTGRLLTLTGTGGVGKTRLALQVARELSDRYGERLGWVDLGAVSDPALVPQAIVSALGVRAEPNVPLMDTLTQALSPLPTLLILDNCEHLIQACAQVTESLLVACASLRILATSREALRIAGETVWQVASLSLPETQHGSPRLEDLAQCESARLLIERARAVKSDFALTEPNAAAVEQIILRLDGIPLAIELAAARVNSLSVSQIAARLNDRFALLTRGNRAALPRHQTLRSLIEWSHELLAEPGRVLWRRLSVMSGGWTLEAAESICADGILPQDQVIELLSQLVDKSLVMAEEHRGMARYRMLETIAQYGQEKLLSSGELVEFNRRHLMFFLQLAEKAQSRLLTVEQKEWFSELDSEYANVRSALDRAMEIDLVRALRLAVALCQYWEVRGYIDEARTALERVVGKAQHAPKELRADGLRWLAKFVARQGDYARARGLVDESLSLSRESGDKSVLAVALHNSGMVFSLQGNYTAAKQAYEQCLALHKEMGDKREIAAVATSLGNVANYTGDLETARRYQEESVTLFRELGDRFGLFIALNNLGMVMERQGDNASARRYYEESIAIAYGLEEKNLVAYALNGLAHVLYLDHNPDEANRQYRESLLVSREIGEKRCVAYCLEGFAKVESRYGDAIRAAHLLGAAEVLRQAIGAPLIQAERDELDQDIIVTQNRIGHARFQEAWTAGRAMTMDQAIAYALEYSPEVVPAGLA